MKSSSPPPAPDPVKTAEAQTKSNKETAIANAHLNRVNQSTPWGSSTWNISGYNEDGTPRYEQTTSLSEPVQGLFDKWFSSQNQLGDIAQGQLGQLSSHFSQPFDLGTAAGDKIWELQRARLDPTFDQRQTALQTQLTNRGIREGTDAWDRAMMNLGQQRNDAYNQAMLTGDQWATQKAMAERMAPLNEFNALMTGNQVGMPQFGAIPGVQQANTDVAGITNSAYQNQLAGWNAQNQQNNAFMGGLFGLGAAAMPFMFSDARLKADIVATAETGPKGLPVYEWTYVWGGPRHRGYMAQDVLHTHPEAVHDIGGYLALDYSRIV